MFSALAAGVIFGSFLAHMVPETLEAFHHYLEGSGQYGPDDRIVSYPWATVTIGLVFILLYTVDRILVSHGGAHGHGHGGGLGDDHHGAHSHSVGTGHQDYVSSALEEKGRAVEEGDVHKASAATAVAAQKDSGAQCDGSCADAEADNISPSNASVDAGGNSQCCDGEDDHDEADGLKAHMHDDKRRTAAGAIEPTITVPAPVPGSEKGGTGAGSSAESVAVEVHSHSHSHRHSHGGAPPVSRENAMRAWVFIFAISVHALFDGLSLGAESSTSGFYSILTAVVIHKAFDGLATGGVLFAAYPKLRQSIVMLAIAAAMTPIGIAIGLGVQEATEDGKKELSEAIIVSMSAGSFLFISVVELLPAALHDGRWVKTKMLAFAAGFGALCALAGAAHAH